MVASSVLVQTNHLHPPLSSLTGKQNSAAMRHRGRPSQRCVGMILHGSRLARAPPFLSSPRYSTPLLRILQWGRCNIFVNNFLFLGSNRVLFSSICSYFPNGVKSILLVGTPCPPWDSEEYFAKIKFEKLFGILPDCKEYRGRAGH